MYFALVIILGFKFFLLVFEAKYIYIRPSFFKLLNTWTEKVFCAQSFLCTKYLLKCHRKEASKCRRGSTFTQL